MGRTMHQEVKFLVRMMVEAEELAAKNSERQRTRCEDEFQADNLRAFSYLWKGNLHLKRIIK